MNLGQPADETSPEEPAPAVDRQTKVSSEQIDNWLESRPDWRVEERHHLVRSYRFADFVSALERIHRIGAVAEALGHHPDLELSWGRVGVKIYTHSVDGLTAVDFQLATRIDGLEQAE
jgi:4a-hydroxytetrahydrobiopterin dehydratase